MRRAPFRPAGNALTGSPGRKRTRDGRAPIRLAITRATIRDVVDLRTALPALDPSLRLAAQEDDEIRALAGLGVQRFVRDDQGRSYGNPGDAIQDVLRNDNPVERGLCVVRIRQHRLDVVTAAATAAALRVSRASAASVVQG